MRERLLDTAEAAVRLRGYNAVSFRELADELGIKSASVHYYFRQKEDLGLALVERYQKRFFAQVEAAGAKARTDEERLAAFVSVYRDALKQSDRMCLCGILGAESSGLPPRLAEAVAAFFKANIDWLVQAMGDELPARERRRRATSMVATLQGAMMMASSLRDHRHFDAAVAGLALYGA